MVVWTVTRWNTDITYVMTIAESLDVAQRAVELDKKFRQHNGMDTKYSYMIEERKLYTAQDASEMEDYYYKATAEGKKYI
jgi:hypothetical protein